jgi:hypothetical protein
MNNFFLKGAVVILALVNTQAFAADMDKMFYWSNANGLVKADNCKLEATRNPKLSFVKNTIFSNTISLEKNQGLSNLTVATGSLVKTGAIDPITGKMAIEIVGVNSVNTPLETEAVRGDNGLVNPRNIQDITSKFIQIKSDYMNVIGGTYWKVFGDDKFLKLNCPGVTNSKEYVVFNVYPENGGRMIARVGVSAFETELFKNIKTYKKSKIYNQFSDMQTDESNAIHEINSLPDTTPHDVKVATKPDVPSNDQIKDATDDISILTGLDTIICTDQDSLNVRNEDLTQVLFTVKNGDKVKIFQGWGNNKVEGIVDGKKYEFIKVEFLNNEDKTQKIGYVVASYVEAKSTCIYSSTYRDSLVPEDTSLTGLDDINCCNFPTMQKVTTNFTEGMRRFGGSRGGGTRIHAAVDLYRYKDEALTSVAPGVVIRGLAFFYQDTYSLEVMHSGGFVVRYGEMTGKTVDNVSIGKQLKMGDRIGYMGKVNSGCCEPMLHFELYSGKLRGSLTQEGAEVNGILYNRRRDLLNPTPYMLKWQHEKFKN